MQIDGSRHDWLEGRGPRMTLLAGVDDATGKIVGALFRPQEDSQGYFLLLRQIVERYGRPLTLYRDRHSIFQENTKKLSIDQQLQGRPAPTQFGRLLDELEIRSIQAGSPQAKGRVERLFGTLQDRLVTEFRLNNVSTPKAAQAFLDPFLLAFNQRFAVKSSESGRAWRKLPRSADSDSLFSFKFDRVVSADNIVRIGDDRIQLVPDSRRVSYARARVQVHIRMDGGIDVFFKNRCLTSRPAPTEAPFFVCSRSLPALPPEPLQRLQRKSPLRSNRLVGGSLRPKIIPGIWITGICMKPRFHPGDIFNEHLR